MCCFLQIHGVVWIITHGWAGLFIRARMCACACVWCDRSNQITGPTVSPVKSMAAETARGRRSRFARLFCSLFVSRAECDLALAVRHQTGGKRRRRLSDTERAKTGGEEWGGGDWREERKETGTFALGRTGLWGMSCHRSTAVTGAFAPCPPSASFPKLDPLPVCAGGDVFVHNCIFLEGAQDGPAHPAKWIFSLTKYTLEQLYYSFLPRISILMN